MTEQSNFKITPSHSSVFYIDSGVTPRVDSAYVAYKIDNSLTSSRTNIWVQLDAFAGGKVSLANAADAAQEITVPASGTYSAFFLLKALGATTSKQSHVVSIWNKRPDLSGASRLAACDFSFLKVVETIKASANKITTVTGALAPTTATLGGKYTITVKGETGKVGSGSTPDFKTFWASPAAYSSWPTRALRLESTEIKICIGSNGSSGSQFTLTNQLFYNPTTLPTCLNGSGDFWQGTYTFRIIGTGPAALSPSPVAIISSGTQYKHSDVNGITSNQTVNLSTVASSNVSVRVSAAGSVVSSTSSSVTIRYTVSISTTSTVALNVDEIVDTHDNGSTFVSGSAKVGTSLGSLTATSDPSVVNADVGKTPPPYHFVGPYSTVSGSTYYIQYDFVIPCTATSTTYSAKVVAYTGDVLIGADATSISTSSVTTSTSVGCATPTILDSSVTMNPSAVTTPADTIAATTANINGYANPVGLSGVQYRFAYSTDPNLVNGVSYTSYTSASGSTSLAISASLTGLTSSTVYYFRAMVRDASATVYNGVILSFQTLAQQAMPTVTTGAATGITGTTVTLNGSLNPNLNAISLVFFKLCTNSGLSTGCITDVPVVVDDGAGATINLTFASTAAGDYTVNSDSITGTQRITTLTQGVTYYYRLSASCTINATYCPSGQVDGAVRTFTSGAPTALTYDATGVADTTATLNGLVNGNTNTTLVSFCYSTNSANTNGILTAANCTYVNATPGTVSGSLDTAVSAAVTGLIGGTTYYYQTKASVTSPAYVTYGSIYSFSTLQIGTASPLAGGTAGTAYSASLSGSGGSGSYVWSTASTLPAGLTLSSSGLISGTPTAGGTYTIVVRMTDPASGQYVEKTFTIAVINPVNIAATSASYTTGVGATVPTLSGTATPSAGISGLLSCAAYASSDTSYASPLTLTANTAAGTYVVHCSGTLAAGYTAGTNTDATLTISSPSTVNIAAASVNYMTGVGATVPTLSGTATPSAGISGLLSCAAYASSDTSYASPLTLTTNTAAGTYVVHCSGTLAANYILGANTNGTLTISAPVTISASAASFTTGVGASVPSFTGTASPIGGITGSITCAVYTSGDSTYSSPLNITANSPAGTYVIHCTAAAASNYVITSNNDASLTILAPISVDVSANAASYVTGVGASVPTLSGVASPSAGATAMSCLAYTNSSFTTPLTLTANTAAGSYPIRCTVTLGATYILGTTTDSTLTIYSPVSITAAAASYVSGMGNAAPTASGSASPMGGISGALNCAFFATSDTSFGSPLTVNNGTSAGTYVVHCSGVIAAGYQLMANNTATLTVNHAAIVTFNGNYAGAPTATTQTDFGTQTLVANGFTRTGYSFGGWATSANGTSAISDQASYSFSVDVDLYATWIADVYVVTYSANTATGSPARVSDTFTYGTTSPIILPASAGMSKTVSSVSYTFGGWSESAGTGGAGGMAVADPFSPSHTVTLYAIWIAPGSHTVTFNSNYPSAASRTPETGSQIAATASNLSLNTFTVVGYSFAGWNTAAIPSGGSTTYTDGASYAFTGNLTLYAQWTADQYQVVWDTSTNGGAADTTATYTYGGSALVIPVPVARTGYDFLGWFTQSSGGSTLASYNGSVLSQTTFTPTQAEQFYAVWQPQQYVIVWDTLTNGGGANQSATFTYGGSALSIPVPAARTGYNFTGWFTQASGGSTLASFNGTSLSQSTYSPSQDGHFYAVWQPQQYVIVWDTSTNGGSANTSATFTYGGSALSIPVPVARSGYDFLGWFTQSSGGSTLASYNGSVLLQTTYTPTQAGNFYAHWQAQQYVIVWDTLTNGGGANSNSTFTYGGSALVIPVPVARSGYDFLGWFTLATGGTAVSTYANGGLSQAQYSPMASGTVFAQWAAIVVTPPTTTPPPPAIPPVTPTLPPIVPIDLPTPPAAGETKVTEGGKSVETRLTPNQSETGLDLKADTWTLTLNSQTETGSTSPLDSHGRVVLEGGLVAHTNGTGFRPNSEVRVYIFNTPYLLGILHTDTNGTFEGSLPIPKGLMVGVHTLQVNGYSPAGNIRSASFQVIYAKLKTYSLHERVYFAPDSSVLTATTLATLKALVGKVLKGYQFAVVMSVGLVYPVDSKQANTRISTARAKNVVAAMRKFGLVAKYAAKSAGRAKAQDPSSRRVEVTVTYQIKDSGNA